MSKEILLLGEFSTGKSAFINMLLGVSILPERLDATDMPVVKIWQAKPTGLFLRERGQKNPLTIDFFSEIPRNWDAFEYAEINIQDHPLLKQGLILWDTPGINSTNPNHQKHLEKFLSTSMRDFELIIFFFRRNLTSVHLEFLKKYPQLKDKIKFVLNIHENESLENATLLINEAKNVISKNGYKNEVILLSIGDLVDEFNIESEKIREGLNDWELIKEWGKRKIELDILNNKREKEFIKTTLFEEISSIASKEIRGRDYYLNLDLDTLAKLSEQGDVQAKYIYSLFILRQGYIKKGIEILTESANLGNKEAQYDLAFIYKEGVFIEKDENLYYHYLNIAVQNNLIEAIAESYIEGINRPKDPVTAFQLLKNEVDGGKLESLVKLAECYAKGEGTTKDLELAEKYYRINSEYEKMWGVEFLAMFLLEQEDNQKRKEGFSILCRQLTNKSDFSAVTFLSQIYLDGDEKLGINPDIKIAFKLLKPYQGRNYIADFYLGTLYLDENDEIKNEKLGFELLLSAYEEGCKEAGLTLSECYLNGIGVKTDKKRAVYVLENLCKKGLSEAKFKLGSIYSEDEGNLTEANRLFIESAEEGNVDATYRLALMNRFTDPAKSVYLLNKIYDEKSPEMNYLLGELYYNDKDYSRSVEYLNKATELGNFEAQNLLGICYLNGYGVSYDVNKAFKIIESAANKGSLLALEHLANFYFEGIGTKKDFNKSNHYLKKVSDQGVPSAQLELGKRYFIGKGTPKNERMGYELIEKAANNSNPEAYYYLGRLYKNGSYVEPNLLLAKSYFEKALESGFKEALDDLSEVTEYLKKTPYARWKKTKNNSYYFEINGESLANKTESKYISDDTLIVFYKEKKYNFLYRDFRKAEIEKWFEAEYIGDGNLTFYAKVKNESDTFSYRLVDFETGANPNKMKTYWIDDDFIIMDKTRLTSYVIFNHSAIEDDRVTEISKFVIKWKKVNSDNFHLMLNDEYLSGGRIVENFFKEDDLICEISDLKYKIKLENFAKKRVNVWHPAMFVDESKGIFRTIVDEFLS